MALAIKDSIEIEHTREKVWAVLFDDATFRIWAEPFCEGSYFEGNVKQGAEVFFLTLDGSGLKSEVFEYENGKSICFKHLCAIVDDEEVPEHEETKKWKGLKESWSLSSKGKNTLLSIEAEMPEEYEDFFKKTWKDALKKIKELCEEDNQGVPEFF